VSYKSGFLDVGGVDDTQGTARGVDHGSPQGDQSGGSLSSAGTGHRQREGGEVRERSWKEKKQCT
jgi:hypothetical protein